VVYVEPVYSIICMDPITVDSLLNKLTSTDWAAVVIVLPVSK
jgi:hypothetical protein